MDDLCIFFKLIRFNCSIFSIELKYAYNMLKMSFSDDCDLKLGFGSDIEYKMILYCIMYNYII